MPPDNAGGVFAGTSAPAYAIDMPIKSICLFCGSRIGINPDYAQLAEALGTMLAKRGVTLVFGGGSVGLMGVAARAVSAAGGEAIGIVPRALTHIEPAQEGLSELVLVDTLHERKALMHARSDAVLALPGGIGTMDELFEMMTWRELGIHDKPIWLLGADNYWAPFFTMLAHIAREGFGPPNLMQLCEPLASLDDLALRLG